MNRSWRAGLPDDLVVDDPDIVAAYAFDRAGMVEAGVPQAVLLPRTTADVQRIVSACAAAGTPIVPRGAGSGLSGGANGIEGAVVVSTTRMDQILELDVADRVAVVQPGVVTGDLKRAAATVGLWYPPDPASADFCSLGGNVATNAGGLCCLKYGVTGDYVLGLEVVLASGRVMRTGRRTVKGVAGLDLTRLFVGSEGRLGVVTEATLRLRPSAAMPLTVVGQFDSLASASNAVQRIFRAGIVPSMLEFMDDVTLSAVVEWKHIDLAVSPATLFAQSDVGASAEHEVAAIELAFRQAGATLTFAASDRIESDALVEIRKLAFGALERLGDTMLDDVCVPLSQLGEMVAAIADIARSTSTTVATFGHAGDGNLHPTIIYDARDSGARAAATAAFARIVTVAQSLGGTCTGEHGVGQLKRQFLPGELDPVAVEVQRAIAATLDPDGLLNPGRGLP